jgi:hypothetical protein
LAQIGFSLILVIFIQTLLTDRWDATFETPQTKSQQVVTTLTQVLQKKQKSVKSVRRNSIKNVDVDGRG